FLTQGPVILLAPVSGVLADRFDRRTLNVMSAALAGVTTGLMALMTWLGMLSLPVELALSLAYGVAFVFQLTLRSTLVPSIVPPFVSMGLRAPGSSYGAVLTSIGRGATIGSLGLARLSAVRFRPALFAMSLVGSGISLALMAGTSSMTVAITSGFFVGATQA